MVYSVKGFFQVEKHNTIYKSTINFNQISLVFNKDVAMEWPLRNPDWQRIRTSSSVRYALNCSYTSFSNNLETNDNTEVSR